MIGADRGPAGDPRLRGVRVAAGLDPEHDGEGQHHLRQADGHQQVRGRARGN